MAMTLSRSRLFSCHYTNATCVALLCFFISAFHTSAHAQLVDFSLDNDVLFNADGTYTNGANFGWLSDENSYSRCGQCAANIIARPLQQFPGIRLDRGEQSVGLSLRQIMVTPEDISKATAQFNDVPYVGALRGQAALFSRQENSVTGYNITLGVIGPDSGAASTQRALHKLTGANLPEGWDTQLGQDPLIGIGFTHSRRYNTWHFNEGRQAEWGTSLDAQLENFYSYLRIGTFIRIGKNLPGNILPDYAGIGGNAALPGVLTTKNYGWSVFAGLAAEYAAYSYIDANADAYSFQQDPVVGTALLGVAAHTQDFHLGLTLRQSSETHNNARKPLHFATISLIWAI